MKIRHAGAGFEEIRLPMTPMIDIIFQLLVFFALTLKIASSEGDFNIKMPLAAPSAGPIDPTQLPPMKVRLVAGAGGQLAAIRFGDRPLGTDFEKLRQSVVAVVGANPGPNALASTEIELDCDYNLNYQYVIQAITAISGYVKDGQVIRLVEKIKFAPPRG